MHVADPLQAYLNKIFLMHNLNNNAGVISQLINEAQEQVSMRSSKEK